MKNYKLHLIRHGISEDNVIRVLGGSGRNVHLSEQGKAHLLDMKEKHTYPQAETLFVSPMKRTIETAEVLYPNHKRILVSPLVEANYGIMEGKPISEVGAFFMQWMNPDDPIVPEGSESYYAFRARSAAVIATLLEGMMKSGIFEAIAVTHGGIIASALSAIGLPEQEERMWYADNGTGYTLSTSAAMWMRSQKAEVTAILPLGYMKPLNREK